MMKGHNLAPILRYQRKRGIYVDKVTQHGKIKMDKYLDAKMTRAKSPSEAINKTKYDVETESLRLAMANKKQVLKALKK